MVEAGPIEAQQQKRANILLLHKAVFNETLLHLLLHKKHNVNMDHIWLQE
jgi:hypothetical protein